MRFPNAFAGLISFRPKLSMAMKNIPCRDSEIEGFMRPDQFCSFE